MISCFVITKINLMLLNLFCTLLNVFGYCESNSNMIPLTASVDINLKMTWIWLDTGKPLPHARTNFEESCCKLMRWINKCRLIPMQTARLAKQAASFKSLVTNAHDRINSCSSLLLCLKETSRFRSHGTNCRMCFSELGLKQHYIREGIPYLIHNHIICKQIYLIKFWW